MLELHISQKAVEVQAKIQGRGKDVGRRGPQPGLDTSALLATSCHEPASQGCLAVLGHGAEAGLGWDCRDENILHSLQLHPLGLGSLSTLDGLPPQRAISKNTRCINRAQPQVGTAIKEGDQGEGGTPEGGALEGGGAAAARC